jgi:hypothetical protein
MLPIVLTVQVSAGRRRFRRYRFPHSSWGEATRHAVSWAHIRGVKLSLSQRRA